MTKELMCPTSNVERTFMSFVEYINNLVPTFTTIRLEFILAEIIVSMNGHDEQIIESLDVDHIITLFGEKSPKSILPTSRIIVVE